MEEHETFWIEEENKSFKLNFQSKSLPIKSERLNSLNSLNLNGHSFRRLKSNIILKKKKPNHRKSIKTKKTFFIPVSFRNKRLSLTLTSKKLKTHKLKELREKSNNSKFSTLVRKSYLKLMKAILNKQYLTESEQDSFMKSIKNISKVVFLKLTSTIFQGFLSLLAIITYIIGTYYPDYTTVSERDFRTKNILLSLKYIELIVAIIILIDLFIKFFFAKSLLSYLFNKRNIVDFVLIIPTFLDFALRDSGTNLNFLKVLRFLRVIRILRLFKIIKIQQSKNPEKNFKKLISKKLVVAIVILMTYLLVITALIHYLQSEFNLFFSLDTLESPTMSCSNKGETEAFSFNVNANKTSVSYSCHSPLIVNKPIIYFHTVFYYIIITMSTVGYGDIFPSTTVSRVIVAISFMCMILVISLQSKEINETLNISNHMIYFKKYSSKNKGRHIIVSGEINYLNLSKFLIEFYHPEHKKAWKKNNGQKYNILIVNENPPEKDILQLISNEDYEENVFYMIGDLKKEEILNMIDVENCKGVFLLSDLIKKNSDYNSLLITKSINIFCNAKVYSQFNFHKTLQYDWADWNYAFSSNKIKDSVIILNSKIKGFATLFMNLACSTTLNYSQEIQENPWMMEYLNGASQEIYILKILDNNLFGKSFSSILMESYINFEVLVIGVKKKIYDKNCDDLYYYEYLLNPVNYKICEEDELIIIAGDEGEASKIFYSEKVGQYSNHEFRKDPPNNEINEMDINLFRYDDGGEGMNNYSLFFEKFRRFAVKNRKINSILKANLKNHYVIFSSVDNLSEFLATFFEINPFEMLFFIFDSPKIDVRFKSSGDSQQKQRLLHKEKMKIEKLISEYKKLVIIECDYTSVRDLELLNLEYSKHTFVLSFHDNVTGQLDSGVIGLIKIIDEFFPFCKHTYELFNENNMKFLRNSFGGTIENQENFKNNQKIFMEKVNFKLWPRFANSEFFFNSSIDYLLPFSYHNKGLIEIIHKILKIEALGTRFEQNFRFGTVKYIGSDKVFYGDCAKTFLKINPPVIPIAIYRNKNDKILKNELPYLITNPSKNLVLNPNDDIIVLGKNEDMLIVENNHSQDNNDDEIFEKEKEKMIKFCKNNEEIDFSVENFFDNLKKEVKTILRKESIEMVIYSDEMSHYEEIKLANQKLTEIYKLTEE